MPDLPAVDLALPLLRTMLRAAGIPFKLVGGVAVIHHGYARTTVDIDVLVPSDGVERLRPWLGAHGFHEDQPGRLRHLATGVRVDVLFAGQTLTGRREGHVMPSPEVTVSSERDPEIVGLAGLLELKLCAGRKRDEADVIELLKRQSEREYLYLEAEVPTHLRGELFRLREDALEELAWARENGT
jgi:hypothetical protein